MSKEQIIEYEKTGIDGFYHVIFKSKKHFEELKEQAERAQELEKERSEWKGKYSVLKNKYRALQRKMKNRWRYNRALENESRTNEIVLEEFREQNKRYREAIDVAIHNMAASDNLGVKFALGILEQALEGEE